MTKLISYKRNRHENRYRTFNNNNVSFNPNANEKITFQVMAKKREKPTTKTVTTEKVHKNVKSYRNQNNVNLRKRKWTWTCCGKWKWVTMRRIFGKLFCCNCYEEKDGLEVDKAFNKYKEQVGDAGGSESQESTLKSERDAGRFWNWDESWKSNSDKFLESLEFDGFGNGGGGGDHSLKRRLRQKGSRVRFSVINNVDKGFIGSRNVGSSLALASSSNTVSPTAGKADVWPTQGDEDIDRLVAMHQKRRHNSLSSLGRSDSMASVYSGAGEGRYGTVIVSGSVEFGMQYNYKQGALEINVKQCKDLAAVDTKRNRSDPYVKVYLLPDKTKNGKRKTKVKKHSLNPVFDEVLRFYMSLSSLESRTLWLTVWHSDMFGRNDFLGEVMISLQNKIFDIPQPQWYQLEERSEPFEDVATYRGDIIVGLKFIPGADGQGAHNRGLRRFSIKTSSSNTPSNNSSLSSNSNQKNVKGALHVLVKEAKHLSAVKPNGQCDAFCKSYLLPDKNRGSKQKTPVVKRSTSPQFNYTFIYDDVTLADLSERALELTIWDHDRLASNEFLGGVKFSILTGDSNGKEFSLWQSMLNRPNLWVEGCLSLHSSLDNQSAT
ncbi:unnamed protein product [Diamesa serratosioi]